MKGGRGYGSMRNFLISPSSRMEATEWESGTHSTWRKKKSKRTKQGERVQGGVGTCFFFFVVVFLIWVTLCVSFVHKPSHQQKNLLKCCKELIEDPNFPYVGACPSAQSFE